MAGDVVLQLPGKVLPARPRLGFEWRLDQLLPGPALDGAACVPGPGDGAPRLGVHRQGRGLLSVGHVGVDDRLIDRLGAIPLRLQ